MMKVPMPGCAGVVGAEAVELAGAGEDIGRRKRSAGLEVLRVSCQELLGKVTGNSLTKRQGDTHSSRIILVLE